MYFQRRKIRIFFSKTSTSLSPSHNAKKTRVLPGTFEHSEKIKLENIINKDINIEFLREDLQNKKIWYLIKYQKTENYPVFTTLGLDRIFSPPQLEKIFFFFKKIFLKSAVPFSSFSLLCPSEELENKFKTFLRKKNLKKNCRALEKLLKFRALQS
jgi:hypothetical protein